MSGKAIQALETVGQEYGTPKSSEEIWVELIDKTQYYEGEILLAHSVNELNTRRYSFYDKVDGIYLLIDLELFCWIHSSVALSNTLMV